MPSSRLEKQLKASTLCVKILERQAKLLGLDLQAADRSGETGISRWGVCGREPSQREEMPGYKPKQNTA